METILSPRLKNIISGSLAALLAAAILWLALVPARELTTEETRSRVEKNCREMDAILDGKVKGCLRRSEEVSGDDAAGRLAARDLERKEALIYEKNGIITGYTGEIFYFRPIQMETGAWRLIKKNQDVYFLRRMNPHAYYVRFFMDFQANPLRRAARFPYPLFDLKFAGQPLPSVRDDFSYDRAQQRFYYTRVLKPSQSQLVLSLVFSGTTLEQHSLRSRKILAYGLGFLLFLVVFLAAGGSAPMRLGLRFLALAGMTFTLWWAAVWLGGTNIYFAKGPGAVQSVFQLLALLIFLLICLRGGRRLARWKNNTFSLFVFNALALASFYAADRVLRSVDFPFGDFSLEPVYLGLLSLLIGLHLVPLLAAMPWMRRDHWRSTWPLISLQAVLLLLYRRLFHFPFPSLCLLALIFVLLLIQPRRFWLRFITPLLLLALVVSFGLGSYSEREKKAFVSENLKPIFSSQDHYAKMVAREIVLELNSRNAPFPSFFDRGAEDVLADCWKNSLAARESIASGIYVVAGDGELLNAFSYQMPYIPLKKENIFPFWHVEKVAADLFGKKVNLAVALINVFQEERYLGYIMVQVLNSADLILKSRERQSILTLDRKIGDAGLGYIKLDESQRILENPANINVQNLSSLLQYDDAWVRFTSMGIDYSGYIFRNGDETAIIFFPENNFFKSFSETVKIICFLLLLAALFNLRRLKKFHWRSFFGSYSMKVFAILVLLSILTAAVFSLFSLNFNAITQETQRSQAAYRRGRAALNIINNLLAAGGEMTQSHIFLLEKILENDISVYEKGTLLFTSDHRKIIRSQLPIYLNSDIRDQLQRNQQQFELQKNASSLDLFFKTSGNYVFDIEFPFDSAEQLRAQRYYGDFMVTIFFVLIVIGLAAAFFFRDRIHAPNQRQKRGMADVQGGNLQPLAGLPAESELRELYQGFNSMLEGIQEQKKNISEISKMKTLVQLGRRVAHEVKNPLTPIRLSAEQILRSLQDKGGGDREVISSAVRYIIEETEHLRRVAFGFLSLSKLDELKVEPFSLSDLVAEAISHLRRIYPQVRFSVQEGGGATDVIADRQKIKQVVDNVLTNALEAVAGREGEIEVGVSGEGGWAEIRIHDNGEGISPDELERIAREEFSSKDLGTGLGLVIARRFLERHRGGLEIQSRPGAGTTVIMRFAKNASQA
jgi:signal transduction histidine kinase